MDERHAAESEIAQSRERIGDLAEELSRRVSPTYVGQRAKEKVMVKSMEWRDRAMESPRSYQLAGAIAGLALGRLFFKLRERRQWDSGRYGLGEAVGSDLRVQTGYGDARDTGGSDFADTGYSAQPEGVREKAQDVAAHVKDRVAGAWDAVKERSGGISGRARSAVSSARDRMPSASEARARLGSGYHHTVDDRPLIALLGAICLGGIAALLMPISSRERGVFAPAKEKVKDQLQKVTDAVEAKVANTQASSSSSEFGVTPPSSEPMEPSGLSTPSDIPFH